MHWRKWIVRGVVYGIIAVCAGGALAYQRWTNSSAVREQVIAKLQEFFPGAQVSVDSARLRILGGIQLTGIRFSRRDDPERNEFLHVPSAVIYHDKQKLLDGALALRKIELYRPRLRVRRDRDGKWNVRRLTGELHPEKLLPTLVVHEGTLLFEDHLDDVTAPLIEVRDIDITLINDPLSTVIVRGMASSETLGKLMVEGAIHRDPADVALSFQALRVPIATALVRRLAGGRHHVLLDGLDIEAMADAKGELSYRPGPDQPLFYDIRCTVSQGKVRHPKLPLPLDEVSAALHCTGGQLRLERLRARSGSVEVTADGAGTLSALDQDFEGRLEVKHLGVTRELYERLPEKQRRLYNVFQPSGPTTILLACARRGGQWATLSDGTASRVSLRPEGASICFAKFQYPVHDITGTLDYSLADRRLEVDVTGLGGTRPVFLKGTWQGEGAQADGEFDLQANDVPIDETLLTALPEAAQKLARSFRPTGKVDIKAHIRHEAGSPPEIFRNEYHLQAHDATVRWDAFPIHLEQARGMLDVYPKHWEFRDFHATHNGGQIDAHGHSIQAHTPDGKPQGIAVEIAGHNVPLDDDLRKGLSPMPGLLKAWDTFRPQGRLNFAADINQPTGRSDDLDVRVDAQGGAVAPLFFPYVMHDIGGKFHYHQHRLDMTDVKAGHGSTLLRLGHGSIDLHPGGGYYADLLDVDVRDLRFDEDFLRALPGRLQTGARSLKFRDACQVKSRLIVAQAAEPGSLPDIYWDNCEARFKNATLSTGVELTGVTGTLGCMGRFDGRQLLGLNGSILLDEATVLKQPFHDVQVGLQVRKETPDVLLAGVKAPIFGGDVAGQVRVDFNSTLRYEVNLTSSLDLKEFGRRNLGPKSELEGLAVGRLHLTGQGPSGQGSALDTLDGHGLIDVPSGKLYNLPLLFDLLKFLGLHWPDRTLFEELHAKFGIHGTRVHLRELDLLGTAISLSGKGEANLDGSDLHIDFFPTWRGEPFLPPAVRPLPSALSKSLLTIEMRGKIGDNPDKDLKFTKRWVPIVFDPLLSLQQRITGEPHVEKKD